MKAGKIVDGLYKLRAQRLLLEKKVEELKAKETAHKALLLVDLPALGLESASGKLATASLQANLVPQILNAAADWPLLYKYIQKHGSFEMLHKRLSAEPFQERWAAGEQVPGVSAVRVVSISLTARKAKT